MKTFSKFRLFLEDAASDFSKIEDKILSIGRGSVLKISDSEKTSVYEVTRNAFLAHIGIHKSYDSTNDNELQNAIKDWYFKISRETDIRYETKTSGVVLKDIVATFWSGQEKICEIHPYLRNSLPGNKFKIVVTKYFKSKNKNSQGPKEVKAKQGISIAELRANSNETPVKFLRVYTQEEHGFDEPNPIHETTIIQLGIDGDSYNNFNEADQLLKKNKEKREWFSGKDPYYITIISTQQKIDKAIRQHNIPFRNISLKKGPTPRGGQRPERDFD